MESINCSRKGREITCILPPTPPSISGREGFEVGQGLERYLMQNSHVSLFKFLDEGIRFLVDETSNTKGNKCNYTFKRFYSKCAIEFWYIETIQIYISDLLCSNIMSVHVVESEECLLMGELSEL